MKLSFAIAALMGLSAVAAAQKAPVPPFKLELRAFGGALVPTGAAREEFKTAPLAGVQGAIELSPSLHVLCSTLWSGGHAKFTDPASDGADVWQWDTGVEYTPKMFAVSAAAIRPFVGIGGGVRLYDYQKPAFDTQTCSSGYGALGTELETGRLAARLEARNYLTCFKSPVSGSKSTRSDIGVSAGLAFHLW